MSQKNIVKFIQYLVYLMVVLVPLIYFPTGIFPFQIIKTVFFQLLTEIIFALWLGLIIFYKEYRPKFTPISIALFIFIAIISLSIVFGSDWRISLWSDEQRALGLIGILHFAALFLVLASINESQPRPVANNFWRNLWFLSFGSAVIVSLIGILQRFIVFPKGFNIWFYILYSNLPERIGSTFSNSSFMAGYLLFNFFIGVWLIMYYVSSIKYQVSKDFKFWFLTLGTILIAIAIFLSQTIGVILGLGVGIIILLLYFAFVSQKPLINTDEKLINTDSNQHKSTKISINLRSISITLLVVIVIFGVIFTLTRGAEIWQKIPGLSRIAQASFQTDSIRDRLIVWQISLKAFKEKPLLGWGFENFTIAFDSHYDPKILTRYLSGTHWDKPHNILLEYLTTTGVLGLLAYLLIFIAAFYSIYRSGFRWISNQINADNYKQSPFLVAMLVAYFFQNIFIFDTIGTYLMFFLALSYIDFKYKQAIYSDNKLIYTDKEPELINQNQHQPILPSKKLFSIIVFAFLILSLIPIYYNFQIFNASRWEYWGVNYFLNRLPESSLVFFSLAINTPTPYIDDIRKNFANTVAQGYQQGIEYPSLSELQKKLTDYLKLTIERHPKNFFNYITLAEFKNVFYRYNPDYIKEAEELVQKALELSPERQQTYYVLARTKILEGDIPAAYKIFEEVVSLNPEAGDPHFLFGLMAYGIGEAQKGAAEIAEAERLGRFPKTIDELITLGNFVGDYNHNYKEAIKIYKQALFMQVNQKPTDKITHSNILLKLAVSYYFDDDLEQSRQAFLELKSLIDLKKLPIYSGLKPVLEELKIND